MQKCLFSVWGHRGRGRRDDGTRTDEFNVKNNLNQRLKRKYIFVVNTYSEPPLTPHKGSFFDDVRQILIFFDIWPPLVMFSSTQGLCTVTTKSSNLLKPWRHFWTLPKRRMTTILLEIRFSLFYFKINVLNDKQK